MNIKTGEIQTIQLWQ